MALSNDPKLFETYLNPVLQPAYGTAYYLVQNREEAENLVQETVLQAFLSFSLYRPGTDFTAWFMKRLIAVFLERPGRDECCFLTQTGDALLETRMQDGVWNGTEPPLSNEPSPPLFAALTEQQIAGAFAQLPEDVRLIVALYFMEELSYQQIADILGFPLFKVRSDLHRGRRALHHLLGPRAPGRGQVASSQGHAYPYQ
jgi:RNA polymerase sigma-70 factor (ECF subfamily)